MNRTHGDALTTKQPLNHDRGPNQKREKMTTQNANKRPNKIPSVAVKATGDLFSVVATKPIAINEMILYIDGRLTDQPSRYSVQISETEHIDLDEQALIDASPNRYIWRYLNHHCEPNARLDGRYLSAVKDIDIGDEITFNYNTNEYEMASPFPCWCNAGTKGRERVIAGYKHLDKKQRAALAGQVANHVLKLAGEL